MKRGHFYTEQIKLQWKEIFQAKIDTFVTSMNTDIWNFYFIKQGELNNWLNEIDCILLQ